MSMPRSLKKPKVRPDIPSPEITGFHFSIQRNLAYVPVEKLPKINTEHRQALYASGGYRAFGIYQFDFDDSYYELDSVTQYFFVVDGVVKWVGPPITPKADLPKKGDPITKLFYQTPVTEEQDRLIKTIRSSKVLWMELSDKAWADRVAG